MSAKVSIIVGIYNVSRFLREKRLACILNQTYKNWELLLVDDGSTDDSGTLCEEFAQEDSRIKVLHQSNAGLGYARNTGMDAAVGDYLWFYDVDDEAHQNLLEYSVAQMETYHLDMLQFGFRAITPSQSLSEEVYLNERLIESQTQLRECYLDDILFVRYGNGFAWNKVLRRSFVERHRLRYGHQCIQQDEAFFLAVYPWVDRVYLSPVILYDYYIYNSGNNRSRFIADRFDIYVSIRDAFEHLRSIWGISDSRFDAYLHKRFWGNVDICLGYNLLHIGCPWTRAGKQVEIARIIAHPYTQASLRFMRTQHHSLETRLSLYTYKTGKLWMITLLAWIFRQMRTLKHITIHRKA